MTEVLKTSNHLLAPTEAFAYVWKKPVMFYSKHYIIISSRAAPALKKQEYNLNLLVKDGEKLRWKGWIQ